MSKVYGVGTYVSDECGVMFKDTNVYKIWSRMLERCYSKANKSYRYSYRHCTVSSFFLDFSNFRSWCIEQTGFGNDDWQLDKDILVRGNKVYSEDTCCFVPREVNLFFTKADKIRGKYPIGVHWIKRSKKFGACIYIGKNINLGTFDNEWSAFLAYKKAKENRAKELANKWYGQIDDRVYDKLMNYKVLITD